MKEIIGLREDRLLIILDNSPVHWSAWVQNYLKKKRSSCIFLPQYTPELAPVELFFCRLKRLISHKRTNKMINLSKRPGIKILTEAIESIDQVSIIKIWSHFFDSLKHIITELDSILSMDT